MNVGYPLVMYESQRLTELTFLNKFTFLFFTNSLIDLVLHPLHFAQSRFQLQCGHFHTVCYTSLSKCFKSFKGKRLLMFKGWECNLPINLILASNYSFMSSNKPYESLLVNLFASTAAVYPFYTLMKRRQCMSNERGMLRGQVQDWYTHVCNLWKNEGIKGYYRGFGGFLLIHSMILMMGMQLQEKRRFN